MRNIKFILVVTSIFIALLLVGFAYFAHKSNQMNSINIGNPYRVDLWTSTIEKAMGHLKSFGIQSTRSDTSGAVEMLSLLSDPKSKINAALIYDGFVTEAQAANLYSLGAVGYDPIWIFYNDKVVGNLSSLEDLAKQKVLVGPKASFSYLIAKKLFDLNGINIEQNPNFISLPAGKTVFGDGLDAFLSGKANVIILSGPWYAPELIELFNAGNKLFEIPNANNYKTKSNFDILTIPAGSMDINGTMPAKDTKLVATTSILAVKKDLSPYLQLGLVMTATEMTRNNPFKYDNPDIRFPALIYKSPIEASPTALKYYSDGPPFMIKLFPSLLPYWPI
jgi:TRAP-type uncharacterized transport system substrate-binding protein